MATKKVTTTTKKNTPSQKHASEPNYKSTYDQHRKMKKQIAAVIMFTAGVLIGAIVLIKGENVWTWIHNFFYGIFGLSAIILPIALIYIAVMATLDKPIGDIKHKIWQTGVLMALFCGLFEICIKTPYVGDNFVDVLGNLFENGVLLKGGGLFSAILGWPLFAACGKAGSITIIILLLFAFIMLLSGATLIGFFKGVAKPVKKMSDSYVQKREDIEKKRQTKFDIDVDLGPEVLPNHPVYSPKPTPQELQQIEKQKNEELKQNQKGKSFDIDDNPIDELINQAISDGSKK
ncbi:MAG: DNA translocase FtsK 4TM domain-containing protein, partial [Oscillospiraceae bacterium]